MIITTFNLRKILPLISIITCSLLLTGCGSNGVEVKGKVYHNKKLLTGANSGVVIFHPDSSKGNSSKHDARGNLEKDGSYQLISDAGGGPNIPLGWYKVSVFAAGPPDPKDEYSSGPPLIPEIYGDPAQSGVSIEVVANPADGAYDVKLGK